MGEQEVFSLLS